MTRVALLFVAALTLRAETGYDGWLRYTPHPATVPPIVATLGKSPLLGSAQSELIRGVRGITGLTLRTASAIPQEPAIVLDTQASTLPPDAYWIKSVNRNIVVTAQNDRGVLYGTFALLRKIQLGEPLNNLDDRQIPAAQVRWVNQWDNLDGSIERGYGGRSIFWDNLKARDDLTRVSDYGRLLASLGINGCSINNVNANPKLLTPELIAEAARIATAFRPWGVQVALSIDFGSPQSVGGLDTFDPLDPRVIAWWNSKVDELYQAIPDLAGFVLKADSEGRVGPSTYNRTHADAANVVARALKPHHGTIFYRGFVYDHHMDWNNPKNDRARAAYDNFKPLDGKFDDNVIIQIKNGPIDFQVREPVSPLFGALPKTNEAIELQVTQEYFGQSRHTVFLVPMWKETLDQIKSPLAAFAGVVNIGLDDNWSGNHLSQANLYGYGRLAWNPALTSRQIVEEWTKQTFSDDPQVVSTISQIQLTSWRTYENYTGPLGLQTLTDITGNHYGVNVEASERNGWGQWHRADQQGVGMDRTVATGTGYTSQYPPANARQYESVDSTPDDLLLFFHHVPYTHVLHSGKTVIQSIYDSHYTGAEQVEQYVRDWKTLSGRVDDQRYQAVLAQLEYQAGQSEVWRDAVDTWFQTASGIKDAASRPDLHRIEAESMTLDGYTPVSVTPSEDASGGRAISCPAQKCSATTTLAAPAGTYTIRVEYFDQNTGASHFRAFLNDELLAEWTAAASLPSARLDSTTSTRHSIESVPLKPGDTLRIEGRPDAREPAALDYVELIREK
jgi:alpha-glucuronidase